MERAKMKTVCLWSGGKDSCFAYYKAKLQGHKIITLFNFTEFNGVNSISHGLSSEIIQRQIKQTGIPFLQKAMPKETYREEFITLMNKWKGQNDIEGIVFGDIYLKEHKDWIDSVCKELNLEPILPLWGKDTAELVSELVKTGFKAIVVSIRSDALDKKWLGRIIDHQFIEELKALGNIDLCGEKGEFHTFVFNGPIFKSPVEFIMGKKTLEDKHWFLEII